MLRFILKALDQHFRPANSPEVSLFPPHEFDDDEAKTLKDFCEMLQTKGYNEVFKQKESPELRDTLCLAAEYGTFVEKAASPWYLGVFIMAECIMEPDARDSFYEPMLRSEVFTAAPDQWKNLALWLMFMALFCDRLDTAPARAEAYISDCSKLGYDLRQLPVEIFCNLSPQ